LGERLIRRAGLQTEIEYDLHLHFSIYSSVCFLDSVRKEGRYLADRPLLRRNVYEKAAMLALASLPALLIKCVSRR
jgi:hypothetical protein